MVFKSLSQMAWVPCSAPLFTEITMGKLASLQNIHFFMYQMGMIVMCIFRVCMRHKLVNVIQCSEQLLTCNCVFYKCQLVGVGVVFNGITRAAL